MVGRRGGGADPARVEPRQRCRRSGLRRRFQRVTWQQEGFARRHSVVARRCAAAIGHGPAELGDAASGEQGRAFGCRAGEEGPRSAVVGVASGSASSCESGRGVDPARVTAEARRSWVSWRGGGGVRISRVAVAAGEERLDLGRREERGQAAGRSSVLEKKNSLLLLFFNFFLSLPLSAFWVFI